LWIFTSKIYSVRILINMERLMRLLANILAVSLLAALPAAAEVLVSNQPNVDQDGTLVVNLPQGALDITMNTVEGTGLFVHAGGSHEVLLESAYMPRLLKIHGNSALLELYTGGNACPILFAWVSYDETGLRASEEFGTCAEEASFEESAKGPVVTMDDIEAGSGTKSYLYDEKAGKVSEIQR
jgi:hypothetical protein